MSQTPSAQERLDAALEIIDVRSAEAVALLKSVVDESLAEAEEEAIKTKELAIVALGDLYAKLRRLEDLKHLLVSIRPFFAVIPKAKTAKIVRTIIEQVAKIPDSIQAQIQLCLESIEWSKVEKRTFLRQRIETKLAALYLQNKQFNPALSVITALVREVKRLDDKALLVEIQLLESQIHHALRNLAKSKGSLTAARTCANGIYCPPSLQAQIDMQSGILNAEEKDFKTAYSYFYEAHENFASMNDDRARSSLKYMLMCKIMTNNHEDVQAIINGKLALKYSGPEMDAMKAICDAHTKRSLQLFEEALVVYAKELKHDPIVDSHLSELYDMLLEQNLARLIEPFSRVEIAHVAHLINLPLIRVEAKLSQMILDKKFNGILDQGAGCLIAFSEPRMEGTYPKALETMEHLGKVVDSLFERAAELS
eukprot:TRINITY_DN972_c0_g5_i1.p1 TRINITY_DN972_c0_g5~~TRINITY_DN972_c0_g5_i1.p1  ORF type:complete len:424 (-),score=121.19 TRINITY_DN972_c0_g5_i1:266-1537(-)